MGELKAQAGKLKNVKTPGPAVRKHYITLSPSDPLTSACRFISEHCTQEGLKTLHYHRGGFFTYKGTHYREADNQAIRTRLYKFLKQAKRLNNDGAYVPFEPDQRKVSNVMDALKAEVFLSSEAELPVWLRDSNIPAGEILACKNGLLHLPTLSLIPHTPAFFGIGSLPYSYNPEAGPPVRWLKFLKQLWPHDPFSISTLQEWTGYLLSADTSQQKILLLIGPMRSGKGTIARVQTKLLGAGAVCSPSLSDLSQLFGLQCLINRRLAVISDARLGRADQSVLIERLLSISGEDVLNISRKHKTAWIGTLPIKLMILSNELPSLRDQSSAATSRLLVLRLTLSFLGREDLGLINRLSKELPQILNWALTGLDRLQKRGHFHQPESAKKAIEQLEELSSPVGTFIQDKCRLGPNCSVSTDRLFRAWKTWCHLQEIEPGSQSHFGRNLFAKEPSIEKTRPRKGSSRRSVYTGVKLNVR